MQTKWFQDLPKPEQDRFKQEVLNSKKVLDKLKELCYNLRVESKSTDYDSPSWAFKQADQNGYNRALDDVIKILTIKET